MTSRRKHRPGLELLEDRALPAVTNVLAVGADPGSPPLVRVLDSTGAEVRSFLAYDPSFTGGVRVAVGDVNGDGVDDIIAAAGPGGGPEVRVFDGATGQPLAGPLGGFYAYDPSFSGGVNVAAADVNRDGKDELIVAPGAGGGPQVEVFGSDGSTLASFYAYDPSFAGGVTVAAGDADADGRAEVITGPGAGGGPNVRVFAPLAGGQVASFYAYDPSFAGGVSVAAGDVNNDGFADVVTGAGTGGGPNVKVFSGQDKSVLGSFYAYDPSFAGGVNVAVRYVTGSPAAEVCTAPGSGSSDGVRTFSGPAFAQTDELAAPGGASLAGSCVPAGDPVQHWNTVLLQTIWHASTAPPQAARDIAIVNTAIYDAVNAIDGTHQEYGANISAPAGASEEVAADVAGARALEFLFPSQAGQFEGLLSSALAAVPDGAAKDAGFAVGLQAASAIIALRQNDGSGTTVAYSPGSGPGKYQLTPPAFKPSLDPQWPTVTPFAMTSDTQFRPGPPPALDSAQYAADFNEVKAIGGTTSTVRTPEQTLIAHFWADVPGNSVTPPGHWAEIALALARQKGLSLAVDARLMALVGIAVADAAIVSWDAKYAYDFWRPVTAIRAADTDGNPDTTADPTWTPLWNTPNFQSYTSGHSTFSGAAATVLSTFFGANTAFTSSSDDMPGTVRTFANFQQAADEAGQSRVYGGIHFQYDNQAGLASGRALGQYIVDNMLKAA